MFYISLFRNKRGLLSVYFLHSKHLNTNSKSITTHTYLASVVLGDHEHLTIQLRLTHCTMKKRVC
jgi:hypothetical protein